MAKAVALTVALLNLVTSNSVNLIIIPMCAFPAMESPLGLFHVVMDGEELDDNNTYNLRAAGLINCTL
jgi:hypothetical protein